MNNAATQLAFVAHIAATLFMTGLIWFVQVVHYPLFATVGATKFSTYEQRHTALTTWVVGPPMLVEGATALVLFWLRPVGVSTIQLGAGLTLLMVTWISTALVQVPCHKRLSQGFDAGVQQQLVLSNWVRTAAWSLRGLLVLWMIWPALR